jgi:hypothetical protein
MEVGDLARLDTPDGDDGKMMLITSIKQHFKKLIYVGIILGETEEHAYLAKELKRL